ncbi:MAG: uracil-DNA glycosylase [Candidatus Margulisbacteria bacterium]|jgi:DNA polymerase|nr:uracil-DNA glycosylase [Candidatus Margulisiibacteriota bacterium]
MSEYEQLKADCLKCTACGLAETRKQVVFGVGPAPCDLMLIGEAPGADEDEQGIPFVGRAGQLLTKMLASVNINRDTDAYIANICKCRPPDNRNPEKEEAHACMHWLKEQIRLVQPKILVLVGAVAMKNMLGEEMPGITRARGKWVTCEGVDTMIIFHPSYLLRNASSEAGSPKWQTWQDLKAVKSALEYKKLEQQ